MQEMILKLFRGGGTISINGDGSIDPEGERIQYIWSFPPSLIFEDNYKYHKSDRVKIHKNLDDNSIESVETYTRAFLLDVPEFVNLYNIKPGDGMYIDPNDRVKIW